MKSYYFILLAIVSISGSIAQNADGNNFNSYYTDPYANIVPPTPSAAGFIQYGDTPVDLSSGLPTISIPIYTMIVDGVQVPISISYHASGVKVDDVASVVGLKWSLNVGGGVYRTIKDLDDFQSGGWINNDTQNESRFDKWLAVNNPNTQFYENEVNQSQTRNYVSSYDQFPDEFNYSFAGQSGEFIFQPNGSILNAESSRLDINYINGGFEIGDLQGNQFEFASNTSNYEHNENSTFFINNWGEPTVDQNRSYEKVGWKLDKINTRNGKSIDFTYNSGAAGGYVYTSEINQASQEIKYALGCGSEGCATAVTLPLDCVTDRTISAKHYNLTETKIRNTTTNTSVSKIESENMLVEFYYSETPPPGTTVSGWKLKLDRIEITDKIHDETKKFLFTYDVFSGDSRLKLQSVQEMGYDGTVKNPYIFTYNDTPLPSPGEFSKDYKGYYNGKNNTSLFALTARSLTQNFDGTYYEMLSDRYYDESFLKAGVLEKIQYPTAGHTEFTFEANAMDENLQEPLIDKYFGSVNNSIAYNQNGDFHEYNFLMEFDALSRKIRFDVSGACAPCSGCGGIEAPVLSIFEYNGNPQASTVNPNDIGTQVANRSLCDLSGYISKSDGFNDNQKYVVQLRLDQSTYQPTDNMIVNMEWFGKVRVNGNGAVMNQKHYLGGLRLKERKDFDDNNSLATSKTYIYQDFYIDEMSKYSASLRNFKQINPDANAPLIFTSDLVAQNAYFPEISGFCYTKVITTQSLGNNGSVVEFYEPSLRFNSIKGGKMVKRIIYTQEKIPVEVVENTYSPSFEQELSFKTPSLMDNTYFQPCGFQGESLKSGYGLNYPTLYYKETKDLLQESFTTKFYGNEPNLKSLTTKVEYTYNDDLLMEEEQTDTKHSGTFSTENMSYNPNAFPQGEIISVEYKYPNDFPNESSLTNVPKSASVSKKVFRNGSYLLGEFWEYQNDQIKAMYRYNQGQGTTSGAPSYVDAGSEKISEYTINSDGKPTEIQRIGGMSTSYLWGYNGNYPIAKIDNASYASISSGLISGAQTASNNGSESQLQSSLQAIRSALPDAMTTTFVYEPFMNLSIATDPKGDIQYYTFDDLGRLLKVKDKQNKLLVENEYFYRPQN